MLCRNCAYGTLCPFCACGEAIPSLTLVLGTLVLCTFGPGTLVLCTFGPGTLVLCTFGPGTLVLGKASIVHPVIMVLSITITKWCCCHLGGLCNQVALLKP